MHVLIEVTDGLFEGAGALGTTYRRVEWSSTSLGPLDAWAPALRTAVGLCLASPEPSMLVLGPDRVVLPNAAWVELLGDRAGRVGQPARADVPWLGALVDAAAAHRRAVHLDEQRLDLERDGAAACRWVTATGTPLRDAPGGALLRLADVTRRVRCERRERALRRLADVISEARSVEAALPAVCRALLGETADDAHDLAALAVIDLLGEPPGRTLAGAGEPSDELTAASARALEVSPHTGWSRTGWLEHEGVVTTPLVVPGDLAPRYALIARVTVGSAAGQLDDDVRAFLCAAARLIGAAAAAARAREAQAALTRVRSEAARVTQALREGEERLRHALVAADMGTWRVDLRTGRETRDEGLNRILGLEPTESTSPLEDFVRRVHPADRARVEQEIAAAVESRGLFDGELRVVRPDGAVRWVRDRGRVLCDERGAPVALTGAVIDITDRKRAEEALRASDERLRTAVWASGTGTYFWDLRSNQVHHDDGVKRLFGFQSHEGGHIDDFAARVHDADRGAWRSGLLRSALDGTDFDMEYRVVWPDGSVHWILDRAKMVRDDSGVPAYMSGACLEITEQKRAQQALREADRRKDEFLAMLGHELRNPLAPIRTAVQLLKLRDGGGPEAARARDVIERQAEHLSRLVDDLLEVSRITSGKIRLKRAQVELGPLMTRAVETCRPMIDARRHELTLTLPDRSVRVEGDAVRLAQVLSNLLNNAAKYTPEGGRIWLSLRQEGDAARVLVKDSGPGIPPDMLERVFELFTQVDRSLDRSQGGLGIGLTLARRLVEMHGGTLRALPHPAGDGAELEVRLPALPDVAPNGDVTQPAKPEVRRRDVLVVDDNVDAAETLAELLTLLGHTARAVHDGPAALEAARSAVPEVVLLDIGLPGMDGFEVARRLRAAHPGVVLVALTGYGQDDDVRQCREAGFDHHRVKPVDVSAIEALLGDHGRA